MRRENYINTLGYHMTVAEVCSVWCTKNITHAFFIPVYSSRDVYMSDHTCCLIVADLLHTENIQPSYTFIPLHSDNPCSN